MKTYRALHEGALGGVAQREQMARQANVLAEAFDLVTATDERWCEAELHRLRGELTVVAEGHLSHALEVARAQSARL